MVMGGLYLRIRKMALTLTFLSLLVRIVWMLEVNMAFLPDASLTKQADTRLPGHGLPALRGLPVQGGRWTSSHPTLTVRRHGEAMGT